MKAIQISDKKPELIDLPRPEGDEVLVKISHSSICGSDLHLIDKGWAEGQVLGHEFAGTTPDGTAVAVEPLISCGQCHSCEAGFYNHCDTGAQFLGIGLQGGMAEYVLAPADHLVALPSGLALANASLIEPLAVALHGLRQGRLEERDRVLVIGAGAIGLATAAVLYARGIPFDISARHPHQQAVASRFGGKFDIGDGYDLVVDAVGTTESLKESVDRCRPRGRIAMLGTHWDSVELPGNWTMKEVELLPAMVYKCREPDRTFVGAARILTDHPEIADSLISHRYPLDAATEAFASAADRASGAIKVCFEL